MKIDFNNYEEWAMDYIEGKIPADIKSSFDLFLAQNPEIKSNIDSLVEDMPTLKCSNIIYPDKDSLTKGGKALTLRACVHYLSGAAVAAVIMFGIFMITPNREDSKMLVAEVVDSAQTVNEVKQEESTVTVTTDHNKIDRTATQKVIPQEVLIAKNTITNTAIPTVKSFGSRDSHLTETALKSGSELDSKILLASTQFESIGSKYNIVSSKADLSAPATLAYISDIEMTHARVEDSFSSNLRQSLASIIAPIDRLNPIKIYKTETGHGIEIASRYRIGRE